ncbi:unnamed protein product [Gongylonema pulchrum]|uniref:Type I restriction endonuclease subunit R n=1 Tax=Gongylonema pulchrum TaxID=637853 RepID=A0A183E680_9BILA|nr:unnamed protein product [Gongylonema pulchrum]
MKDQSIFPELNNAEQKMCSASEIMDALRANGVVLPANTQQLNNAEQKMCSASEIMDALRANGVVLPANTQQDLYEMLNMFVEVWTKEINELDEMSRQSWHDQIDAELKASYPCCSLKAVASKAIKVC